MVKYYIQLEEQQQYYLKSFRIDKQGFPFVNGTWNLIQEALFFETKEQAEEAKALAVITYDDCEIMEVDEVEVVADKYNYFCRMLDDLLEEEECAQYHYVVGVLMDYVKQSLDKGK